MNQPINSSIEHKRGLETGATSLKKRMEEDDLESSEFKLIAVQHLGAVTGWYNLWVGAVMGEG